MHRGQLRDALVLGQPTGPIRKAIAALDVAEAEMREEIEREADALADATAARTRDIAVAVDAKIAAIVAGLSAPRAP